MMSFILSLHAWEGFGVYAGAHTWTVTAGWATFTLTRPTIEQIIKRLKEVQE